MSIDDKENGQVPEPNEEDLIAALKNKDDIPILMDVILDDLKVKVSQEDYLFNSISDPIPVISDVSDMDVANIFSEEAQPTPVSPKEPLKSVVDDVSIAEKESAPSFQNEDMTQNNNVSQDEESEAFNSDTVAMDAIETSQSQNVGVDNEQEAEQETKFDVHAETAVDSRLDEVLPENDYEGPIEVAPPVILLPHEENEVSQLTVPSVEKEEPAVLKNITMVNTTTFNQDDLKAAIERAFTALLPELMDQVLKELSTPTKKE